MTKRFNVYKHTIETQQQQQKIKKEKIFFFENFKTKKKFFFVQIYIILTIINAPPAISFGFKPSDYRFSRRQQ